MFSRQTVLLENLIERNMIVNVTQIFTVYQVTSSTMMTALY
jgi:hypothetical protein